jgi:Flp pilus assembly CpaF family ATPase
LTTTILPAVQVRDLVEKLLKNTGRRIDLSTPVVDAMLPDGSRLHVVNPDLPLGVRACARRSARGTADQRFCTCTAPGLVR